MLVVAGRGEQERDVRGRVKPDVGGGARALPRDDVPDGIRVLLEVGALVPLHVLDVVAEVEALPAPPLRRRPREAEIGVSDERART